MMLISLIVAMDRDRAIGSKAGNIPWDLPRDREFFRSYTESKWLAIGRKTYREMEGWFSGHHPIVITRQDDFEPFESGHQVASSLEKAIAMAAEVGAEELVVCGGAELYKSSLPLAEQLRLTRVDTNTGGELRFPDFETLGEWSLQRSESHPADHSNTFATTFEFWKKNN